MFINAKNIYNVAQLPEKLVWVHTVLPLLHPTYETVNTKNNNK